MGLLGAAQNLPANNDSGLGSRQSIKTTAKVQLVKSYKQKDPALFAKLMAAVKSFFPEEPATVLRTDVVVGAMRCLVTLPCSGNVCKHVPAFYFLRHGCA